MPKPSFLTASKIDKLQKSNMGLLGGRASAGKVLNFSMDAQEQTNWCWAAVSRSVAHFFTTSPFWTQCEIATKALKLEIGGIACCTKPVTSKCNIPWYLGRALDTVGAFKNRLDKAAPLSTLKSEIDKDRPLCVRVAWNTGGGHFLVILGWKSKNNVTYFEIDDPIHGRQTIKQSKFTNNYKGSGSWSHSYFVKNPSAGSGQSELLLIAKLRQSDLALGA